jgi:hypothetical protein
MIAQRFNRVPGVSPTNASRGRPSVAGPSCLFLSGFGRYVSDVDYHDAAEEPAFQRDFEAASGNCVGVGPHAQKK